MSGIKKKCIWLPYDFDTAIGINNEGALVFSYNLEDIDQTDSGADVFNGQKSVLWNNLRDAFGPELKEMYQDLRSTGAWSYDSIEKAFEEHQAKWGEAIFNEDSWFKYLQPLVEQGTGAYLAMLQGSKEEQRKWWLYNRFKYLDSKYNAGDALSDVIQLRGYNKADVSVVPYADIYATVKYGSYLVQTRATRNKSYTLNCPLDKVNDTEIYIYSASQLASVGDLSGLKVGFADFSFATKIQNIKLGSSDSSYDNGNLKELYLGNNVLLKTLDVRNCSGLGQGDMKSVDISGCSNIEEVYFEGTSITGVSLPNGGTLKVLHLPGTITNLTLQNQKALTDFSVASYSNISTLWLENVSSIIDEIALLKAIPSGSRVRLIGFYLEVSTNDELDNLFTLFNSMRGLDEYGNNMDTAQLSGTVIVHTTTLTGTDLENYSKIYPYVTVTADSTTVSYLNYYTYDGSELLYTVTVYNGGDASQWSGKPERESSSTNSYAFIGWNTTVNSEEVEEDYYKNVVTNRNVYAAYKVIELTEDKEIEDSWDDIITAAKNGSAITKYKIGNYKPLDLGDEGIVNMVIVAKNTDDLASGSGKAPLTFISKECLKSSHIMNPLPFAYSTGNGWVGYQRANTSSELFYTYTQTLAASEIATMVMEFTAAIDFTISIPSQSIGGGTTGLKGDFEYTVAINDMDLYKNIAGTVSVKAGVEVSIKAGAAVKLSLTFKQDSAATISVARSANTSFKLTESNGDATSLLGVSGGLSNIKQTISKNKISVASPQNEGEGMIGGWEKSSLRSYLKDTILPLIPTTVRNAIKELTKTQPAYDTSKKQFTQTTTDSIWIPSREEINGESATYYTYFKNSDGMRIKNRVNTTSAIYWWLRSAYYTYGAWSVYPSGQLSSYVSYGSVGIALGFSI